MKLFESGSVSKDRILKDDIVNAFNTVLDIVKFLKESGLIKEDPKFDLGSTKLAYRIFKKKLNQVIDDIDNEDMNRAELNRLEGDGFGDLDIDIMIADGKTLDDVEKAIMDNFGDKIWKSAPKGERAPGQLHFGFKIGNKVHQVDFVELRSEADRKVRQYFSGSSATDEALGIKGLFNKEMHYALTHVADSSKVTEIFAKKEGKTFDDKAKEYDVKEKQEIEIFKQELKEEKISKNYVVNVDGKKYPVVGSAKGKLKLGAEITNEDNIDITPTLDIDASQASFVVVTRRKVSLIESKLQETYGLVYRIYLYRQKFKEDEGKIRTTVESTPKKVVLEYIPISDPESVIKVLLGDKATSKELYSAVDTAKFIGNNFPEDKKLEFWNAFVEQALEKRNKLRLDRKTGQPVIDPETGKPEKSGQVSEEKYDNSMRILGKLIGMDKILGENFYVLPPSDTTEDDKVIKEVYNKLVFNEAESIRTGIGRFEGTGKLSGDDFLKILKAIYPHINDDGTFMPGSAPNIDVVEKVDSSFCHFGINKDGKFFMASSNSGEVTEDNFEHRFKNNPDFLESFRFLKDHKLLHVVLKNISKEIGKPVKFEAEILPSGTYDADEAGDVTFVGTKYSKEKLGEKGAFVIFKAQVFEGEQWSRIPASTQKKLISDVLDADSSSWKLYSNDVHMKVDQPIQFGSDIKQLANYFESDSGFKKLQDLMDSKMTPEKRRVKEILNNVRVRMQQALDDVANNITSNLGKGYAEGIILRVKDENGDVMEVKGTSQEFSSNKERLWKHRNQLEELFDQFKDAIKTKVLQLKLTSDRSINQTFLDTAADTEDTDVEKFMISVINKLIDKNADFSNVKGTAKKLVRDFKSQLVQLKSDFKANQESFDVNSMRKTKESFTIYEEKFQNLFNILLGETENDLQYVLNCFNSIYEGKAKNLLNSIGEQSNVQTKKCALWVGRAQPWHKGHDQMIKIGLEKAECVFVVLVKGAESSQDETKNPLSTETQKEIIKSLYPSDKVIVCENQPLKASLPFIMTELFKQNLEATIWLVGEDRKDSYKSEISRFKFDQWTQGHNYIPVKPNIEFVITPRVASATDAREMAKDSTYEEWITAFAPDGINSKTKVAYKKAYDEIRGPIGEEIKVKILEFFNTSESKKKASIPIDPNQQTLDDIGIDTKSTNISGSAFSNETEPDEKPEINTLSKEQLINEFESFYKQFKTTSESGMEVSAIIQMLFKIKDSDFGKKISPNLLNNILHIVESLEHNVEEKQFDLTPDEKSFLAVTFAEVVGPLALRNIELIKNTKAYDTVQKRLNFKWNNITNIRFPTSSSNKLFDSIVINKTNKSRVLISSKHKKGAAANIGVIEEHYHELRKSPKKEWTNTYNLNNNNVSPIQLLDSLFNLHLETSDEPLNTTFNEARTYLRSDRKKSIYTAVNLAAFALDGFDESSKSSLYKIIDFIRAATYVKASLDNPKVADAFKTFRNLLIQITKKIKRTSLQNELVQILIGLLKEINNLETFLTSVYKYVGYLAVYSVKIVNDSDLKQHISDIIRECLVYSSVMQLSCTYESKLMFTIIHPINIGEGLIKLNAYHNYLRETRNFEPNGTIAFELPSVGE